MRKDAWIELRREIEANGLEEDPVLQLNAHNPVFGLNLALGWPLPVTLRGRYEIVARNLSSLDSGLYVYPYRQTHVTVMTLMNFKYHPHPSQEDIRGFRQLVPIIASKIAPLLSCVKPFTIDVGPPVLTRRAGFLPILNETGEIAGLRSGAASAIKHLALPDLSMPQAIHSTIARFLKRPPDTERFVSAFESIASNSNLGQATVDEFLITSETKPYMLAGEILHRFRLGS